MNHPQPHGLSSPGFSNPPSHCSSLSTGWKSPDRAFQKGVGLLRTESRDNEGAANAVDRPDQGESRDAVRTAGQLKGELTPFVG